MNGQHRKDIHPGLPVAIVLKKDQRTGHLTEGIVKDFLCRSLSKPSRSEADKIVSLHHPPQN